MPQLRWFVTGCTSGIGEAFVRSVLARGDKVVASARGDVSRLDFLKDAGAETISLDVTASIGNIREVAAKVIEGGTVDVLVNTAGYIEAAMVEEARFFETNFYGVVKTTQAFLPHFREKRSGTVVIIGSSGGIAGEPGAGLSGVIQYCATKFALEGWYDSLKLETAHLGIKSFIFELGFHRTKIMHPDNVQKFRSEGIADYDAVRNGVGQFVQGMNGTQLGDPNKAVKIMVDFVRGEGVAEGKVLPERLPLGPDCLEVLRKRSENALATCNEWEDVIRSTSYDLTLEKTVQ